MAEEADGQDTGAEASGAGIDPAAVALVLGMDNANHSYIRIIHSDWFFICY